MRFKRVSLEFKVSAVDEIKLLLDTWRLVMARFQEGNAVHQRVTEYHLVNIKLDELGPEEVLVMQFIGKPEMLNHLIDELKALGWEYKSQILIPGMLTRGQLKKGRH